MRIKVGDQVRFIDSEEPFAGVFYVSRIEAVFNEYTGEADFDIELKRQSGEGIQSWTITKDTIREVVKEQ